MSNRDRKNRRKSSQRPPETEARAAIVSMLVVMLVLVFVVLTVDALGTTGKSILLIGWMGAMMMVLKRYRL